MNTRILNYIYLLLFLVSCSAGNGIYQSSYPSYLKNRSTKQISAQSQSKLTSTAETSENSQQSEYKESEIQNPHVIQDSINTYDYPESFESVQTPEASQYLSNSRIENNELNNIIALETYQSDCPTINDLACQYLGDGVYMLTWSVPKIPIYTENGTLSEYRITRRSLEDNKAFLYKTPEPDCVDGNCTIFFKDLGIRTGYIWSVDTRCSRTTFTTSNKVVCGPYPDPMPNKPENTNLENTQQNTNANNNDNTNSTANNDRPRSEKYYNKNALVSVWLVPIMLLVGFFTVISLLFGLLGGEFVLVVIGCVLLLMVIIGCVFSIYRGSQAINQIKSNSNNQKGTGLAILGIIGSTIGLIISTLILIGLSFEL